MYEWDKDNDRVIEKNFRRPGPEERPPQGMAEPVAGDTLPGIAGPSDMLPDPAELIAALTALSGLSEPTEAALKASFRRQADTLQALWNSANQQRLGRNRGERRAAGRSRATWKYIKKVVRSATRQQKIDMVP